jgi:hypothetical protein
VKKILVLIFLLSSAPVGAKGIPPQITPKIPAVYLFFSDHPEVLHQNGLLFSAGIIPLKPIRLNYYHQNGRGEPERLLVVFLENFYSTPALASFTDSSPPPSSSIMETGHKATVLFLKKYSLKTEKIITIPPHHFAILSKQILKQEELGTGFIQIQELKGPPLALIVSSQKPYLPIQTKYIKQYSNDPHAKGGYVIPHLFFSAVYKIGDPEKNILLGDLPLPNLLPGKPLKGSYGMIWEGKILIFNPSAAAKNVSFWFEPRGGSATATFILNHKIFTFHYTPPYRKEILETLRINPDSWKSVHFLSMPEGGSSYPIDFIVGEKN